MVAAASGGEEACLGQGGGRSGGRKRAAGVSRLRGERKGTRLVVVVPSDARSDDRRPSRENADGSVAGSRSRSPTAVSETLQSAVSPTPPLTPTTREDKQGLHRVDEAVRECRSGRRMSRIEWSCVVDR